MYFTGKLFFKSMSQLLDSRYKNILIDLKEKIRSARIRTSIKVNYELLKVYWEIGNTILAEQHEQGWGAKIIDRLADDLKQEFPDIKGFSRRNLSYMKVFAEAYPEFLQIQYVSLNTTSDEILQQGAAEFQIIDNQIYTILQHPAAKLPWTQHQVILDKVKEREKRLFYIQKSAENGWSRNVLSIQIESQLFERQGNAITNFSNTLPPVDSDLAQETIKNPYIFGFLSITEEMKERDVEKALIHHLKAFMLELGKGFAYIGNQKNLNVKGDDFFLDLLFFNYHLNCFVIFELKLGEFKPEYAGKLNFYVNTVDEQLKGDQHKPTIGILLCKTPNETVVKYSLQGITAPIGVSEYQLAQALPKELRGELPSMEELEAELDKEYLALKSPAEKKLEAIKHKIAEWNKDELKEVATYPRLCDIFDNSLLPLYQSLLLRLKDFDELFMSHKCLWIVKSNQTDDMEDLAKQWKNEELLQSHPDLVFNYRLNGFKKAGVNSFNASFELKFRIETYCYTFTLINHNNQQPFVKKAYHEQLSQEEIQHIGEVVYNDLVENIDRNIGYIER